MFIKKCIPRGVKAAIKAAARSIDFSLSVRKVLELSPGEAPSRSLLNRLRLAWSNQGYSADLDYLEEVAKRGASTSGPILECGSGLTTVVLGLMAGRRGVKVWTLEHTPQWHAKVEKSLQQFKVPNVTISLADLRSYGEYSWYDPPFHLMPKDFSLVICDGPPGSTPGGRYGLLPVCVDKFIEGATILLDDADRPSEEDTLRRWQEEYGTQSRMFESASGGSFAVVTWREKS